MSERDDLNGSEGVFAAPDRSAVVGIVDVRKENVQDGEFDLHVDVVAVDRSMPEFIKVNISGPEQEEDDDQGRASHDAPKPA